MMAWGCISSGLGSAGKSRIGGFGTGQNVIQGQQLADQTVEHTATSSACAPTSSRPPRRWTRTADSPPHRCSVGTTGVEDHGFGVAVRHGFAAPLHRGCTESVRREHAGHRVKRAVVDHESEIPSCLQPIEMPATTPASGESLRECDAHGATPILVRPASSGRPSAIFNDWTACPAVPRLRLSMAAKA